MDLESIVKYRDECIICCRKLKFYTKDHKNLQFDVNKHGFRIKSGAHESGIRMQFNFDGTYQRNKRSYKIYDEKLTIFRYCAHCQKKAPKPPTEAPTIAAQAPNFGFISYKHYTLNYGSSGVSSLNNMKNLECNYCFRINGYDNTYDVVMNHDSVRYYNDEYFYHID